MEEKKHRGRAIGARQNNIGEKPDSTVGGGKQLAGHALENLQEKIGDRAENVIGNVMENTRFEAPELRVRPGQDASHQIPGMETYQWYRVPVEGGKTADGSEYRRYRMEPLYSCPSRDRRPGPGMASQLLLEQPPAIYPVL